MVRRAGLIFIFLIFLVHQAQAEWVWMEDKGYYYGTTDQTITFRVDQAATGGAVTHYDWRIWHVERQEYVLEDDTGAYGQYTVQLPRTGHYIVEVRARNSVGASEWIKSTDPAYAMVDDQPKGWQIYGRVAGPGPLTIE